jgi:nucleoporin p58/p45
MKLIESSGSLGNNQNQVQSQASGLFNQSQQQPKPQGFGGIPSGSLLGGTLGQANNQQQHQTVPGVRIDTSGMRGTTRFNDLHENLQQQIELYDKLILQEQDYKAQCQAIMPSHGDQLSSIPHDVEFCRRKLIGLDAAMSSDTNAIAKLQELIKKDIEHGQLSGRAIDNLRLPIQYHVSGAWPPKSAPPDARGAEREGLDFVGYFSSTADELAATLDKNRKNIADIELHLRSIETTSGQQVNTLLARKDGQSGADDDAVRELAAALVEFEQGILNVAGKVGATREGVQTLQLGDAFGSTNGQSTNGKRSGIY